MTHLAIIETTPEGAFISVQKTYFECEPETFETAWANGQQSLEAWAQITQKINYGVISYCHSIGALWIDENNEFQVNFQNFTVASVIEGILANEKYLPEEMVTHMGYIIVKKAVNTLKKLFPKGRDLPIDIGAALDYLKPLLPTYVEYSRRDPEIARLFEKLLPQLETFLQPLTNAPNDNTK